MRITKHVFSFCTFITLCCLSAHAQIDIVPEGVYRIQNVGTGKFLKAETNEDVTNKSLSNDSQNKKWKLKAYSDSFVIENNSSSVGFIGVRGNVKIINGRTPRNKDRAAWNLEFVEHNIVRFKNKDASLGYLTASANDDIILSRNADKFSTWRVFRIEQGTKFEPWDKERWAAHYKGDSIIKLWDITEDTYLGFRSDVWQPKIAVKTGDDYAIGLFNIRKPGIVFDGNKVRIDNRKPIDKIALEEVYKKHADNPMSIASPKLTGVYIHYTEKQPAIGATIVKNFNIQGFRVGIDNKSRHPGIIEYNAVSRNDWGLYQSGWGYQLRYNVSVENYEGGVYSGSKSRDNVYYKNTFRDNHTRQRQPSYGSFVGDAFLRTQLIQNRFIKPRVPSDPNGNPYFHQAISFYRNAGEKNSKGKHNLREEIPHYSVIKNNYIDGYSCGVHIASRMGRFSGHDMTKEGRDYAFYNQIENNEIKNTVIGIKINSEGNTIRGNDFENVEQDIVLHCVFDELKFTTIEDQKGDMVHLWYRNDEWNRNPEWFRFQRGSGNTFTKKDKVIEVISKTGTPNFSEPRSRSFKLNPRRKRGNKRYADHRFGLPIDISRGEFFEYFRGQEVAAIYDKPISNIKGKDYYTIVIMDRNGIEINRAGRSPYKWKEIEAGPFIRGTAFESEIAAIPAEAIDGKYPVFLFRRGDFEPRAILCQENTDPKISIFKARDGSLQIENCAECEDNQWMHCANQDQDADKNKEPNYFSIYPNPSKGIFEIATPTPWKIINIQGKVIRSGSGTVINISDQPDGMYFFKNADVVIKLLKQ